MELNWSTFVLEIINFLVLVWILKHFLYKPVLTVIARRQAGIEKTLADADTKQAEAKKLQQQYEGRLADWERERQKAREALARDLEAERTQKMAEVQTALAQEQEKARVAETRRQADALHKMENTALAQGARFATRLLEQAAGPETEAQLVELVITGLSQLSDKQIADIRNNYGKTPESIEVISAFPLADDQQQRLKQALEQLAGTDVALLFKQDRELLAGIRITIGAWVLSANLRDELKGFAELSHEWK